MGACSLCGKGNTDSNPTIINSGSSRIVYRMACPAVIAAICDFQVNTSTVETGYAIGIHKGRERIGRTGSQRFRGLPSVLCAVAAQCPLDRISASSGIGACTACAAEGPRIGSGFNARISKQLLSGNTDGCGTNCSVVALIDGVFAFIVNSVAGSKDISCIVRGIGVCCSLCIIEQIMGQNIVRCIRGTICAIISIGGLTMAGISNRNNRTSS